MTMLHRLIAILVTIGLAFGAGAMPAAAGVPALQPAMAAMPDSHGDGCADHAQGKKSDSCCSQCPCCIALPSVLAVSISTRTELPVALPLLLPAGRKMAPDPAPPRSIS